MPKLIVNAGSNDAWEFDLRPGENRLGSDPTNDCPVEDSSVSGFHARVDVTEDRVTVTDLGSSNGTFIDREPVSEAELRPGQILRLGGVEILFAGDEIDSPRELAPEPAPVMVRMVAPVPVRVQTFESAPATAGAPVVRLRIPRPEPVSDEVPSLKPAARVREVSEPAVRAEPPLAPPIPARAEPPLPPAIPTAAEPATAVAASPFCKFHPKTLARWVCPRCGRSYCELCVSSRRVDDALRFFCRPCGEICSEIETPEEEEAEPIGFVSQIPGAFLYPFKGDGIATLIVGTAIFVVVGLLRRFMFIGGTFVGGIAVGYTFLYMQNIITRTATGDERKADLPDMEGIFEPFLSMVGSVALCFAPAFGMLIWYEIDGETPVFWGCIAMFILCGLYYPMAFLAVAIFDTLVGINPVIVVPAILKVPFQYLLASVLFGVVLVASTIGQRYLNRYLPIPIVPSLICNFISLYCLTVQSRILGLLYYTNYERIGWLK